MRHIEPLDGLRAIAVLLVVFFHLGYLRSGWVGVQIFFVLSGYLITAILVHDRERYAIGPFLRRFYWRRTLRIFPLYYGYLLAITGAWLAFGLAPRLPELWPYVYGYGMDFARMKTVEIRSQWFDHLWSLAIEEQFYLIWPWLVFAASPRMLRRVVIGVIVAAPLLRFAIGWLVPGTEDYLGRLIYVLPLTQFDGFATGAAIAVFRFSGLRHVRRWCAVSLALTLGLGMMNRALSVTPMDVTTFGFPLHPIEHFQHVWGYTMLNLTAGLMILACVRGTPVPALLGHPLLTRIGRVSYGVYIYHFPLIGALSMVPLLAGWWRAGGLRSAGLTGAYLVVLWAVSEISYHAYEKRFLALKDRVPSALRATPWSRRDDVH